MRSFKYLLTVGLLLLMFMAGCDIVPTPASVPTFVPPPRPTTDSSSFYVVERGTIREILETRGKVVAKRESFLFFPSGGWIKEIEIAPGDTVEEGAFLAKLDAFGMEKELMRLENELALAQLRLARVHAEPIEERIDSAKANLEKARVDVQLAQTEYDKVAWRSDLAASPQAVALQKATIDCNAALSEYKKAEAEREIHQLEIRIREQIVKNAQAMLDRQKECLDSTFLRAPFSGVIISIDKVAGEYIGPYEALGAIADPSELQLEATVSEEEIQRVWIGQVVTTALDAYPKREFTGKVREIATKPTVWQGRNVYKVTMDFDEPKSVPATIRMGADVAIVIRISEDTLIVPIQAIHAEGDTEYVEVVVGEGKTTRVAVQTGISNETQVEILAGLREGQRTKLKQQ